MEKSISRFQDLPNELIIDIYKYLNAREIFQSFYHINIRFKKLFESIDNLQLTVSLFDSNEKKNYEEFFISIQILIIDRGFNIDLKYFKNLRRLMLRNPKEKIFEQLNHHSLPYIEYLSITHKFLTSTIQSLIIDLYQRIFSKHFLYLKFCNLSEMKIEMPIYNWQQSLSLYILKVGQINIFIYRTILSLCPNLYLFELKKFQNNQFLANIELHSNLKYLIIKDEDQTFPWNDKFINDYLICVPNL
ncbi:unnamed protein product, partial [Rotaria sp. Silwood1]